MELDKIDSEIRKLCPIHGVDSSGRIYFDDQATDIQKALAESKMQEIRHLPNPVDQDLERIKEILSRFETATAAEKWEAVGKFLRKRING